MILNDKQLVAIFDLKDDGYLRITKQALESLRDTIADLQHQLGEVQEKVDRAVLEGDEWWAARFNGGSGLCAEEVGCCECKEPRERLAANRDKVKAGEES